MKMKLSTRKVLNALRDAYPSWLTTGQLDAAGGTRFGTRKCELVHDFGIPVDVRRVANNQSAYRLKRPVSEPEGVPPASAASPRVDPGDVAVSGSQTGLALFDAPPATRSAVTGQVLQQDAA